MPPVETAYPKFHIVDAEGNIITSFGGGTGGGDTSGLATNATLIQVRDRLSTALVEYNATPIELADGESAGLQGYKDGSLKVNPGYLVLNRAKSTAFGKTLLVKNTGGDFFRAKGYSKSAGFIQVHNSPTEPEEGDPMDFFFACKANDNFEDNYDDKPLTLSSGIYIVFSTTAETYTPPLDDPAWFDVGYL